MDWIIKCDKFAEQWQFNKIFLELAVYYQVNLNHGYLECRGNKAIDHHCLHAWLYTAKVTLSVLTNWLDLSPLLLIVFLIPQNVKKTLYLTFLM